MYGYIPCPAFFVLCHYPLVKMIELANNEKNTEKILKFQKNVLRFAHCVLK